MYRTTRLRLKAALEDVDRLVASLPALLAWAEAHRGDRTGAVAPADFALERAVERLFQSMSDVGLIVVEWVVHREAGGFEAMIDILLEEGAVLPQAADGLRKLTAAYRTVSREYLSRSLDAAALLAEIRPALQAFVDEVRAFLRAEGVALEDSAGPAVDASAGGGAGEG
ncbi:hypothetical protein [Hydrogenibacillus sp. N12]|uniref:hypothetical protein n=1 Tax=Hydrogenibacillus sp. N12 TaxID=2866627 RepID=UPI001C7D11B2|nr:hypothetical protein [Hydrogenibacillus sp. N12]QZA32724.1 hypothetical protein K2M58_10740 [Hydrogenibacillus sp. N12]